MLTFFHFITFERPNDVFMPYIDKQIIYFQVGKAHVHV